MDINEKVKSRWTRSFFTAVNTRGDEERYICNICQKHFASPSNLTLHSQVHVIERKFKCEPCQVSFHSQGHLQKHKRSSAHETRVQMTQAFGIPTSDNPRPYGCPECDTAFRKHGHLAKHLRSKSHITRLESNGLIPMGTYAALEKSGQELKDKLVTTNCEQSLNSIRQIAMQLFDPQQTSSESQAQTLAPRLAPLAAGPAPAPPQQAAPTQVTPVPVPAPAYMAPELMANVDPSGMMNNPSLSMSAPLPMQPAAYYTSTSVPQLQSAPGPVRVSSGSGIMLPPSGPPPLLQHQPPPPHGGFLSEDPASQMMMMTMIPQQQQTHSLDYTMRHHHHHHYQ